MRRRRTKSHRNPSSTVIVVRLDYQRVSVNYYGLNYFRIKRLLGRSKFKRKEESVTKSPPPTKFFMIILWLDLSGIKTHPSSTIIMRYLVVRLESPPGPQWAHNPKDCPKNIH